jgi:hypothetical protein
MVSSVVVSAINFSWLGWRICSSISINSWDSEKTSSTTKLPQNLQSLAVQNLLKTFDTQKLEQSIIQAFKGDLTHKCMGRSAPARLKRTKMCQFKLLLSKALDAE